MRESQAYCGLISGAVGQQRAGLNYLADPRTGFDGSRGGTFLELARADHDPVRLLREIADGQADDEEERTV
ncbi:Uncharacterised protein [Mycobacteroides abscessus subsp. abscessus]|nr:Uncharacterised protein [Mycobacteroides abscessus subsp. abscessus]